MAAKAASVISFQTGEDQETIIKNLVKVIDLRAKLFSMGPDGKEHIDPNKLGPELQAASSNLLSLFSNYLEVQRLAYDVSASWIAD